MQENEEDHDVTLLFHHVFGVLAIINAVIGGYASVGISAFSLLVEVSSVFLNYRILIDKSDYDKAPAIIIFLSFLLTFTVFRIIMLPYALFLCYKFFNMTFNSVNVLRKTTYIIGIIQFVFLIIINWYWYYKILRILKKVISSDEKVGADADHNQIN